MTDIHSLLESIQADIVSPQSSLHSILLKTKVLAYRLDNDELKRWVKSEINGYSIQGNIPNYRLIDDTAIHGTFTRGNRICSHMNIGISTIPEELREGSEDVWMCQGIFGLEGMAKKEGLQSPLSYEWVQLFNIHNAQTFHYGGYQLIEAHRPILGTRITQIIGIVRSRLQDFILEISNLNWGTNQQDSPFEQIEKIFNLTIIGNKGTIIMSNSEPTGDTYNVNQAGAVGKYARSDSNTFIHSEQTKSLAEVAQEIQLLLKQLEETNPNATEIEKINYVDDETTPNFKRRAAAAFLAGGETAIDEFILDNKLLKVAKASIKAWIKPE